MVCLRRAGDAAKPEIRAHARRAAKVLAAAAVVATPLVVVPASASAAGTTGLPKSLAMFAHCPISNKKVSACLVGLTGGTFTVGSATLTLPSPATLTLGLVNNPDFSVSAVAPTDGTPALQSPTVNVPVAGGLVSVGATPALAALPTLSLSALLSQKGVATTLPLVVTLSNPLLGSTCTIGTTAAPLTVNLTTGTTDPPAPNTPITGSKGTLTSTPKGLLTDKGVQLVDNAFAAPGASGCGPLGLEDPLINSIEGLPSAAGTNAAVLQGTVYTAPASLIRKYLG